MSEKAIAILVGLLGLALCTIIVWLWNFIPLKEKLKRFANREELTLDEIYLQFFASMNLPKESFLELWNEVADSLRLPRGKLRPGDRFDKELAPAKGWEYDDEIADVYWAAQHRLKIADADFDVSKIQTLGNYVEFFSKLKMHAAAR